VFVLADFLKTFQPTSGPLSSPLSVVSSSSSIAPLEASPGGQSEKKQFSKDATRLGGEGEAFRQEREELRAAKTALSEEILELRRANLLLLETVKEGSAIAIGLTEDLRCVRREKEEEKERTEMLSQENVDLRRKALDHKRVRREEENKLEAANNEIRVLKGRLDEMAREAAREREALDKAWQRKLDEAEVLARIAIKEARHSGTTGVAEELAAIAFGGHVKTWVRGE
jgi:chromosome segregation ATPase